MEYAEKLKQFEAMVAAHDLTYTYSDDHRSYKLGRESMGKIRMAQKELLHEDVVRIWNAQVDKKIRLEARAGFYWTV